MSPLSSCLNGLMVLMKIQGELMSDKLIDL